MSKRPFLKRFVVCLFGLLIAALALGAVSTTLAAPLEDLPVPPTIDASPPAETAKLVFVHASIGEAWLASTYGGLGPALGASNYFVSDFNVHNHPDFVGHDYCAWRTVFSDPDIMDMLYQHNVVEGTYTRPMPDPGSVNNIIMIKPCGTQYPIYGQPDDPPSGVHECSIPWTVGDIKQVMLDILEVFRQNPDTFYVLVIAPPQTQEWMTYGENARAVSNWMVHDWLDGYDVGNVFVFDLYDVLTSNAEGDGDPCPEDQSTSDLGLETGNHHRLWGGQIQHQIQYAQDYSAYCWNHPVKGGNLKATGEFTPLLNVYYNAWVASRTMTTTDFTADPRSGPLPLTVRFTDTSTGGDPLAWAWDFGDGEPLDFRQHPTHTYASRGSYTVTLVVTRAGSADGTTVIKPDFISVTYPLLEADFVAWPLIGLPPLTVTFSDISVGTVLTRHWDFGDGYTASLPGPTHTYDALGRYTVTLTIQDAHQSDILVRPYYITATDVVYKVWLPIVLRSFSP